MALRDRANEVRLGNIRRKNTRKMSMYRQTKDSLLREK